MCQWLEMCVLWFKKKNLSAVILDLTLQIPNLDYITLIPFKKNHLYLSILSILIAIKPNDCFSLVLILMPLPFVVS